MKILALILFTFLIISTSCDKDDNDTIPTLSSLEITDITPSTATSGGNITNDGGSNVTARGVCWSTSSNPTTSNSHTSNGTGTGGFTSLLTGLTEDTTYYVRAYATNSEGAVYGNEEIFKTEINVTLPTVSTNSITNITQTTATSGGNITSDGGSNVTARGVCWTTSQNPTTSDNTTNNGIGIGGFTSLLTGLTEDTTYYVRAYAVNSEGTAYGFQKQFIPSYWVGSPPAISCPLDVTSNSEPGVCGAVINFADASAIDTEDGALTTTQTMGPVSGSVFPIGNTIIIFSATDSDENTVTCNFTVAINDLEPPIAMCQDFTIELDASGMANIIPTDIDAGSTDNCTFTMSVIPNSFSYADVGENIVTLTVTDVSGNTATCVATVTVEDN